MCGAQGITLNEERSLVRSSCRSAEESLETPLTAHLDDLERLLGELQRHGGEGSSIHGGKECSVAGRTSGLQELFGALRAELVEYRHAVAEVAASLADFKNLYNEAPVGYHSLDPDGRFLQVNDTELSWLGYVREELLGKPVEKILTPFSQERFRQVFPQLKRRGWIRNFEVEIVRKDGSILRVLLNATAVKDASGRFLRSRSTFCDISEQKRMETLLQASAKQWETTFNAIQEGVCVFDAAFRIVRCNRAMTQILQAPRESLLGRQCCDVFHHREFIPPECLNLRVRRSRQRETAMARLREQWFAMVADPVLDKAGNFAGVVYSMSDVTAISESEEAREAAERELAAQRVLSMAADRLRTLGEMAAAIAHELNQPLAGTRGLAEHLLIGLDRGWHMPPAKQREKLALIVEQADRMAHIIERVRMFAREAGKLEVRPVQLNDVVRAAIGMVDEHFRARGITLECELAEALPTVPANPFSLEEVLLNLMTNARDAVVEKFEGLVSPPPARILVRTLSRSCGGRDCGAIEVIDEGVGIPAENVAKVFEPFFTTKPPNRGTGIGLAVCKHIIEQFGGTITIQSQLGHGATVTIVLPVRGCEITSACDGPQKPFAANRDRDQARQDQMAHGERPVPVDSPRPGTQSEETP